MAASTVEVPIFTETNLGTRIAMAVPPDITARDFKREAERVHFNCFPKSGEIMIQGLMGKKGTWFLHVEARPLSDLSRSGLPKGVATKVMEHVLYDGRKDAVYLEPPSFLTNTAQTDTRGEGKKRSSERSNCIKPSLQELQSTVFSPKEKTNKRLKKHHLLECTASEIKKGCNGRNEDAPGVTAKERSDICLSANEVEAREGLSTSAIVKAAPSDVSSEVVSVTAIIKRYFPISNEVSSLSSPSISDIDVTHRTFQGQMEEPLKTKAIDKCSSIHVDTLPGFAVKTPPRMLPLQTTARTPDCLGNKPGRYKVGKRLILASSNLRTSGSKQRPTIPLCRFKDGKVLESSMVKNSVFEISDSDD
nr:uncharacterized protein LOC111986569 isoform X2 [Quercus suber]